MPDDANSRAFDLDPVLTYVRVIQAPSGKPLARIDLHQ